MDSCAEHVILACGLCLLSEEREVVKQKYWIHSVFWAKEEEGEFHTLFGSLADNRQKFCKYIRMGISKF
jgi:hypothetical protein